MTKRWIFLTVLGTTALALALLAGSFFASSGNGTVLKAEVEDPSSRMADRPSSGATARPPRFDQAQVLRRRVEVLSDELAEQQREEDRRCSYGTSASCPFLSPSPGVLAEMARCGTIRLDMPDLTAAIEGRLGDQELSPAEARAVQRAATIYRENLYGELKELYQVAGGGPGVPGTVEELQEAVARLVSSNPSTGDGVIQRKIARERAGLEAAPSSDRMRAHPPKERFLRLQASIGDAFQQELAQQLGAARARELRHAQDGWTFKKIHVGRCQD